MIGLGGSGGSDGSGWAGYGASGGRGADSVVGTGPTAVDVLLGDGKGALDSAGLLFPSERASWDCEREGTEPADLELELDPRQFDEVSVGIGNAWICPVAVSL
ncbi:hypothetical protein FRC07_001834 [Ceratobasidium sp. 392]|nr:hypothetical protein FRC07_001834 [Ceratobasidium sp. 392]